MFYIQQDGKILLFDEDKQKLQNTIVFTMPQYQDLEIKEVQEGYTIVDFKLVSLQEEQEIEQEQERERLDNLSMTRGDVFEALILAKGLGKAQIRSMIEQAKLDTVTKALYLNRFDEALEFYRGYPIFDMLGEALDITPSMLDRFFDEKDYHYLTKCKLTINPIPAEAKVTYDQNPAPYREVIHYKVELEGYKTVEGDFPIDRDFTVDIELEKIEEVVDENTTDTTTDISDEVGE